MNKLTGKIAEIHTSGAIQLVDVDVCGQNFSVLLIESVLQPDWLAPGKYVDLVFKETGVTLAMGLSGAISTRNRMLCRVIQVVRSELLSRVALQFHEFTLEAAVTTRSLDQLCISTGQEVEALVKSNEIALMNPVIPTQSRTL